MLDTAFFDDLDPHIDWVRATEPPGDQAQHYRYDKDGNNESGSIALHMATRFSIPYKSQSGQTALNPP
jgi:hypothetical protein